MAPALRCSPRNQLRGLTMSIIDQLSLSKSGPSAFSKVAGNATNNLFSTLLGSEILASINSRDTLAQYQTKSDYSQPYNRPQRGSLEVNDRPKDEIQSAKQPAPYEDDDSYYIASSGFPSHAIGALPSDAADQKHLKIVRKKPISTTEVYDTKYRDIGIATNGIPFLSQKDDDVIFNGPLKTIDVSKRGNGYKKPPFVLVDGVASQAKTKLARTCVDLLDEWIPIVIDSDTNDDPLNPIFKSSLEKIKSSIKTLVDKIKYTQNKYLWIKAAMSIITTDLKAKLAMEECKIAKTKIKIYGIAKAVSYTHLTLPTSDLV